MISQIPGGVSSSDSFSTAIDHPRHHSLPRDSDKRDDFFLWAWLLEIVSRPTAPVNAVQFVVPRTTANPDGHVAHDVSETGPAVYEIRRRSGLDWNELADMFGVSEDEVCKWASGLSLGSVAENAVRRTLEVIRHLDRGSSYDTRQLLLTLGEDGRASTFVLLREKRFDEVMARAGGGFARPDNRPDLSDEEKNLRRPEDPMLLLQADASRPDFATNPRIAKVMRAPPMED